MCYTKLSIAPITGQLPFSPLCVGSERIAQRTDWEAAWLSTSKEQPPCSPALCRLKVCRLDSTRPRRHRLTYTTFRESEGDNEEATLLFELADLIENRMKQSAGVCDIPHFKYELERVSQMEGREVKVYKTRPPKV